MFKGIYRNLELFTAYLAQFLKVRMSFKGDFLIGTFVSISYHGITLFAIDTMLRGYPTLNEWKKEEIFFIYALCAIPLDIFGVFFTNLYNLSRTYIVEGEFDRLLVRPINPLLQLFMERISIEKISGIVVGFVILLYASEKLEIIWGFGNVLCLTGGLLCGTIIYAGVFTAIGSLGFWMPARTSMLPTLWNLVAFGRYPVDIYNGFVRFIICFVIPFGFVSFFPASQIMGYYEFRNMAILTPFVAFCAAFVGYSVWTMGVRKYESAGN
ncbi:MAG TPA: ABC-2 family transporter protein [Candidatus Eremiobacteraeota bacterium]|nr:MAG: hypothetical protein BWY64_03227 [bacterium ADurb.Bin363]HPZ08361.1 ABC-2 family transporter protein [Candidatus Eremiobacteraeota bacterium]